MFTKSHFAVGLISIFLSSSALSEGFRLYKNPDWGFSVKLPDGINYETNRPPNPNHGFKISMSADAFVWVNADSSDDESLTGAVKTEVGLWLNQGCHKLRREAVRLGTEPAEKIFLSCFAGIDRSERKRVTLIIALNAPPGINNTAYVIGAAYPDNIQSEKGANSILETIRRGFNFNKLD